MVTRTWGEFMFAPPATREGEFIVPEREETHHLFHVRRVLPGDEVFATDGEGMVYRCVATTEGRLRIVERIPELGEPLQRIALCLAVLQADALREAVDQATQLGAGRIILFAAERSQSRFTAERLERLRRVAISAIKQCGRARLPQLLWANSLPEALAHLPAEYTIFLAHPLNECRVPGSAHEDSPQALIIGPEGGLSHGEVESALRAGAIPLTLGGRRLRSATAVAAGLSFLLTRMGECG